MAEASTLRGGKQAVGTPKRPSRLRSTAIQRAGAADARGHNPAATAAFSQKFSHWQSRDRLASTKLVSRPAESRRTVASMLRSFSPGGVAYLVPSGLLSRFRLLSGRAATRKWAQRRCESFLVALTTAFFANESLSLANLRCCAKALAAVWQIEGMLQAKSASPLRLAFTSVRRIRCRPGLVDQVPAVSAFAHDPQRENP